MKSIFKSRSIKIILGVVVLIGLMMSAVCCMHGKKEQVITEVHAYINDTIEPELKLSREKLDNVLTVEEKLIIDSLRIEAKAMADKAIKFHVKMAKLGEGESYQLSESEINYMRESQKQLRTIITECWTIMDNHESYFSQLNIEMYPKMIGWHKGIMRKVSDAMPHHFHGHGKKGHMHGMKIKGLDQVGPDIMSPVFFILYEPQTNFPLNILKSALQAHKGDSCHK